MKLKDESEWFKIPEHHSAIVSKELFEKANASIRRFSLPNKSGVTTFSVEKYSAVVATMPCHLEIERGFIAAIPKWQIIFLVTG